MQLRRRASYLARDRHHTPELAVFSVVLSLRANYVRFGVVRWTGITFADKNIVLISGSMDAITDIIPLL